MAKFRYSLNAGVSWMTVDAVLPYTIPSTADQDVLVESIGDTILNPKIPVLPAFSYQADTDALVAKFTTAPSTRRKKTIDEFYRTVKNYPAGDPVWPKIIAFGKSMTDANGHKLNWKDLNNPCNWGGGTAFTASDTQYTSSGSVMRTPNIYLDTLPVDNVEFGIFATNADGLANSSPDIGARDATNGFTMSVKQSSGTMAVRCGGPVASTVGVANDWNSIGLHSVCRRNNAEIEVYKGSVLKAKIANASAALPHLLFYPFGQNQNGTAVASTSQGTAWYISYPLSDAQRAVFNAALTRLHQKMSTGDLDDYMPGTQPQNVTQYDYLIWSSTFFAVCAAYELKRQGKSVCIIGDMFDRRLGGMSSGGLGHFDTYALSAHQGIGRYFLRQAQILEGKVADVIDVRPQTMERVLRQHCDPTRTNGLDIPIFWSKGIESAVESSTSVTIKTRDGRTFVGKRWLECGDENVLTKALGITVTHIREAATASGMGSNNGVRPPNNVFKNHAGNKMQISPFVVPNDPASGLIAGVHGFYSDLVTGAASPDVQAFNERIIMTNDRARRVPFPSTPPAGYSASQYELLGRQLAMDPTILMEDIFARYGPLTTTASGGVIYDVNNGSNGMSSDCLGDFSRLYVTGTYAEKAVIRPQIRNHILGLIYYIQYDPDPRVPAALRTQMLGYGLVNDHFCDPDWEAGEIPHWPNRTYVREPERMVSDFIMDGSDMDGADGTVPRSTNTVSAIAYPPDSHSCKRYAYQNNGVWETVNEGGMFIESAGGANKKTPLPYETCLPKRSQAKRGLVVFGGSIKHDVFGGSRMELVAAQTAQSCACALMIAEEQGIDVQDVDPAALRARILATATLSGETTPYLPQVN